MGNRRFKILRYFILFALSVGLMKPQRGSTPIMGKEKNWKGASPAIIDTGVGFP
jgi:hypothetical protein